MWVALAAAALAAVMSASSQVGIEGAWDVTPNPLRSAAHVDITKTAVSAHIGCIKSGRSYEISGERLRYVDRAIAMEGACHPEEGTPDGRRFWSHTFDVLWHAERFRLADNSTLILSTPEGETLTLKRSAKP